MPTRIIAEAEEHLMWRMPVREALKRADLGRACCFFVTRTNTGATGLPYKALLALKIAELMFGYSRRDL